MSDSTPVSSSLLLQVIEDYESKLKEFKTSSSEEHLLALLMVRDQVHNVLKKIETPSTDNVQQLIKLDSNLADVIMKSKYTQPFPAYRKAIFPSENQWWWYLDQEASAKEEKKDFIWNIVTVFLFTITGALTLEIIKRFLIGSPDEISYLGTLLILTLTSSSFTAKGRKVWQWVLEKIPRLKKQYHAEAKCIVAVITALFVLGIWRLGMPFLAKFYNDAAYKIAEKESNLAEAVRYYQRAAALAPDDAQPRYNLGRLYEKIGRIDEAAKWYQQALERDIDFPHVYNALGRMFILQKHYESAVRILSAGLKRVTGDTEKANYLRYRLLQTLGWAYYENGKYELAQEKLEEAIAIEEDNKVEIYSPVHYFLANVFEKKKMFELACEHWGISQRYPDSDFLYQEGWKTTIREKIQNCSKKEEKQ
jgi:tetratricopeptide (TPR) repeat protein